MTVTTVRPPTRRPPRDTGVAPKRWTREEYHRAADLGLFDPEERLELLDGEIIRKMTHKPPHYYGIDAARQFLSSAFAAGYYLRIQAAITLDDSSEPEPDVVVAAGTRDDYVSEHPRPRQIALIVEVSDTTLRFDRTRKRPAYARSGIVEYWILNLPERQLEVHRDPRGSRYRSITILREQDTVSPLGVPHATVRVADLLPPGE